MIGARASFCAAHKLPQHAELHGHSYEVWAYTNQRFDVEAWQQRLRAAVSMLDHRTLSHDLSTMEQIAGWIGVSVLAEKVVVLRPVEGLSAEWISPHDLS